MTGADAFALTRYETALQQFQSYVGDPVATIDEALQATPSFISGHLLKALVLYTLAERKFAQMAGEALAAAKSHAVALLPAGGRAVVVHPTLREFAGRPR